MARVSDAIGFRLGLRRLSPKYLSDNNGLIPQKINPALLCSSIEEYREIEKYDRKAASPTKYSAIHFIFRPAATEFVLAKVSTINES